MSGLYIHVPFCRKKCVYCGFYSIAAMHQKSGYMAALTLEIELRRNYLPDGPIQTVYFGGGTPSLLTINEINDIKTALLHRFEIAPNAEISLEANPEQLTPEYCDGLLQLGVNRLSIGVQSFQDHVLQFMGRRHNATEALTAIRNAHQAGFLNLSIDLIYGVSERDDTQWREDIQTALSQPIQHLSCYALTPEENSILYQHIRHGKHAPVDDDQATRQYGQLLTALKATDFRHYEVSNFARAGCESRHNSSYWNHTPYLGLGPAAHSFDGHSRQWNPANLKQYVTNVQSSIDCEERETLTDTDLYNEMILLGLRTSKGIDLQEIGNRFGTLQLQQLLSYFENDVPKAYFTLQEKRLRLTETGLWFADGIASNAFI